MFIKSSPLHVEEVYIELLRDSRDIIDAIGNEEINDIIGMLRRGERNPDHLDFLSVLCECEDVAIHEQQTRVCSLLLDDEKIASQCLFETRFVKHGDVEVRTRPNAPWVDLREYVYSMFLFGSFAFLVYDRYLFNLL